MICRLAVPADADALVRLNVAFNGVEDVSADAIRRSLLDSAEVVAVADMDGVIVGFACAQVHHSFCYPSPEAEITEMYVDPSFRRMGCGTGLLRFLAGHLRRCHGVDALHLLTGCGNLPAQAFYRACGFREKPEMYMTCPTADATSPTTA